MSLVSRSELLFSVKSFAAAMLAVYLSMRIGLPRPFWAMMTAYIVAAPFAGPTRSKGVYRAGGTLLGAIFVTFAVPRLVNAPELLSLVIALWIGGCLYVSLLDRTPRSYMLMLAGYSAGLIAFPAVNDPGAVFDIGLARVEEITLGMLCATLVHSLVLPQPFGPVILRRLDGAIGDARHWIADALHASGVRNTDFDRRKLAGDITELRLMSTHLPFDTSHLRWTANAVHALQERLAQFVSIVSGVEDRLQTLRALDAQAVAARWQVLLDAIVAMTDAPYSEVAATSAALYQRIDALPAPGAEIDWIGLLELNLAARLRRLVDAWVETSVLRQHIDAGVHGKLPAAARHQPGVTTGGLHLDHGMAALSACATIVAVLICCAFWILTGWPAGATAPMMAAVLCCFFSTQDDPVPFIKSFLAWTVYSVPASALYLLVLLPAVHSFEMFVLICAPAFLAIGVLLARPSTFGRAMPFLFGICGTLAMIDTHSADMVTFVNVTLAQLFGVAVAAATTGLLRRVGADWTARRLLKAGWRELARLGGGEKITLAAFSARMVDRIALLTPRLAQAGVSQASGAFNDLRIGLNMTVLQNARADLGPDAAALAPVMRQLATRFALLPARDDASERQLLAALDHALRAISAAARDAARARALASLTSVRRDLFPSVPPYQPMPTEGSVA
ncbi:FUSC family protein [Massilia sp. S19_KUP03_FR1]|uniref:FUSC family protein n=1 Tax=Massilia sp. S19_KUP03_FR1 TaxID=3025503 RepID=UPI002FCD9AD8